MQTTLVAQFLISHCSNKGIHLCISFVGISVLGEKKAEAHTPSFLFSLLIGIKDMDHLTEEVNMYRTACQETNWDIWSTGVTTSQKEYCRTEKGADQKVWSCLV